MADLSRLHKAVRVIRKLRLDRKWSFQQHADRTGYSKLQHVKYEMGDVYANTLAVIDCMLKPLGYRLGVVPIDSTCPHDLIAKFGEELSDEKLYPKNRDRINHSTERSATHGKGYVGSSDPRPVRDAGNHTRVSC